MQRIQTLSSREDYLVYDEQSDNKHEFYHSEIFAMAGGTFNHASIAGNVYDALRQQLRNKPCQPMNSDMRIHTPSGLDAYPDISVYCGQPELIDDDKTLINPVVLVEVLSPGTRDYDRGHKFTNYRSIVCLQDYLLIDSECVLVEHYHRLQQDEWLFHEYTALDVVIELSSIGAALPFSELYESIFGQ